MPTDLMKLPDGITQFNAAKEQIAVMASKCQNIVVNSKDSLEYAKKLTKDATSIGKIIEDKRKEITKPILDYKTSIDDFAKELVSELNTAIASIREQIKNYEIVLEKARQEELRKIQAEQKRLEDERLAAETERLKLLQEEGRTYLTDSDDEPLLDIQIQPASPKPLSDSEVKLQQQLAELERNKSKSIRLVWDFNIVNQELIPIQFLMPDEAKIKAAVRAGYHDIPGVKVFQREDLYLR